MQYSEDQLRDYAMRVAWEAMPDEDRQQMLTMARAALAAAETMAPFWQITDPGKGPGS